MKMDPGEVLPKVMYRDVRPDPTLSVLQTSQKTITYFGSATNLTMLIRGKNSKPLVVFALIAPTPCSTLRRTSLKKPIQGINPPPLKY